MKPTFYEKVYQRRGRDLNPDELSLASLLSFSIHLRLIINQSQAMLSLKRLKAGALPGYAISAAPFFVIFLSELESRCHSAFIFTALEVYIRIHIRGKLSYTKLGKEQEQ